jgi:hypothetical protein
MVGQGRSFRIAKARSVFGVFPGSNYLLVCHEILLSTRNEGNQTAFEAADVSDSFPKLNARISSGTTKLKRKDVAACGLRRAP